MTHDSSVHSLSTTKWFFFKSRARFCLMPEAQVTALHGARAGRFQVWLQNDHAGAESSTGKWVKQPKCQVLLPIALPDGPLLADDNKAGSASNKTGSAPGSATWSPAAF